MKNFSFYPLKPPLKAILKRLQIPASNTPKEIIRLIEEAWLLIEPQARVKHLEAEITDKIVYLPEADFLIYSKTLARHCQKCRKLSLLALTIGPFLEEKADRLKSSSSSKALVFDATGSEAAEAFASQLEKQLQQEIRRSGFYPCKRYSPGYGDLPLSVQQFFFDQLQLEELAMRLTPSFLIIPQKSITAFIGWRKDEQTQKT